MYFIRQILHSIVKYHFLILLALIFRRNELGNFYNSSALVSLKE